MQGINAKTDVPSDAFNCVDNARHLGLVAVISLPDAICSLTKLEALDLEECSSLESLPVAIGKLTSLKIPNLAGCRDLRSLPPSIWDLPRDAAVSLRACPLQDKWRLPKGQESYTMAAVLDAYRRFKFQSLLGDRDARNQSLNQLSLVAVLLATAAFVAFSQHPGSAGQFEGREDLQANIGWMRHFFKADQVAFYLSMVVVLLVMVSQMPQEVDADPNVDAGRVWSLFALLSVMLFSAVLCGMFAFLAGAVATYPHALLASDVLGPGVLAIPLVLLAALQWATCVFRLYPGWEAFSSYLKVSILGRLLTLKMFQNPAETAPRPLGLDELAVQQLDLARESLLELRTIVKQLSQIQWEMQARRVNAEAAAAARRDRI